ncbi:MAG: ATP-binding protein [Spirochaetota bacterium]
MGISKNTGLHVNAFNNRIRSRKEEADQLIEQACSFLRERKEQNSLLLTNEFYFRLVIDETIENARIHGNRSDESKFIEFSMTEKDNRISITVRDEGTGFDPHTIDNPMQNENRLKRGGRGIHLVKNLAHVSWNTSGNEVTVIL